MWVDIRHVLFDLLPQIGPFSHSTINRKIYVFSILLTSIFSRTFYHYKNRYNGMDFILYFWSIFYLQQKQKMIYAGPMTCEQMLCLNIDVDLTSSRQVHPWLRARKYFELDPFTLDSVYCFEQHVDLSLKTSADKEDARPSSFISNAICCFLSTPLCIYCMTYF